MEEKIIGYCRYCNGEIYENEGHKYISGRGWFHYDENDPLLNCYFAEEEDEE